MKFVSYIYKNENAVGVLSADEKYIIPAKALGYKANEMNALIAELSGTLPELKETELIPVSEVTMEAPIITPLQDVICLGLNYRDHASEASKSDAAYDLKKGNAVYFAKRVNKAVGPNGEIDGHFDINDSLDFEVELAVVIGKDAYKVKAEDVGEYIFGYTILNDVSARTLQTRHSQWYFGKSLDGFTPIGPCITTVDELGIRPELNIRCTVNGVLRQDSNTRCMIFDVPYVIEELSAGMTLKAGTIISTGTPSGVALGMDAKVRKYLSSGDVIRCEIEKIGVLENTVK